MPDGSRGDLEGPASVVLLCAEDDLADTIRPRLEAAGAALERQGCVLPRAPGGESASPPRLPRCGGLASAAQDLVRWSSRLE